MTQQQLIERFASSRLEEDGVQGKTGIPVAKVTPSTCGQSITRWDSLCSPGGACTSRVRGLFGA